MRRLLLAIVLSLAFFQPASADTVDLISLVDLNEDVVNGNWQIVNGELIADETPAARINFPYRPPLEYDYTVEFTLTSGANPWGNIAQLSSHGDVPFAWSTNAGTGHYCRLEDINGHSVIGNPTKVYYPFVGGHRYTSIVRVRNDRVICEIDGQKLVEYETDYSDLSRNQKWEMPDQLNIGLGGYAGAGATTTFHSARVTPFEPPPLPYVDTGFTGRTTGEGDLVVARENYKSSTRQQAIYFRMAVTDDANYEIGGTITFPPGISIVDVYSSGSDLNGSDADWAIAGGDYSGSVGGFDSQDTISWDLHTVSFNAHFSNPVDDFRVVIEYDDPLPQGASFNIQLLEGQGQYQPAYSKGMQVGNTSDGIVPGSGDYGEITQLTVPLTPPPPELVGQWSFNENAGSTVYDSSSNGNDGQIIGATWTQGSCGSSLSFDAGTDGSVDYVNVPYAPSIDVDTFTVSLWTSFNRLDITQVILQKRNGQHHFNYFLGYRVITASEATPEEPAGTYIKGEIGDGSFIPSIFSNAAYAPVDLVENVYYYLSLTYDGEVLKLYINGILVGTKEISLPGSIKGLGDLHIGTHGITTMSPTDGIIDEVRIYNHVLTKAEIQADMNLCRLPIIIKVPSDYPTIQEGIDAAMDGDIVLVADGTYTGTGNRNIDFGGKAITVRSENGPENCIIDGEGEGRGVYFHNGEGPDSVLEGFTIKNFIWRGILIWDSSPTINNCNIIGNTTTGTDPVQRRGLGAGILITSPNWSGSPTIKNCTIRYNFGASESGGGIFSYQSSPTIQNCDISFNEAKVAGGVGHYTGKLIVTNCTIIGNTSTLSQPRAGGIEIDHYWGGVGGWVTNSVIWGNSPANVYIDRGTAVITYSDIQGGWEGEGNIDADPLFVNSENGDFHLQVNSPCIDAGTNTAPALPDRDFEGDLRIVGSAPDMGVDEYLCAVATYYRDADGDGYGNPSDSKRDCSQPSGYVSDNTDCDDSDPIEHPNQTWYKDQDNDRYSDGTKNTSSCTRPSGYKVASELKSTSGDCDDTDDKINPAGTEICNGKDDDCDGSIDEGVTNTYYRDADGDSYGDPGNTTQACSQPSGYVTNTRDCDDTDPNEHPNQIWYKDLDSDGYSDGSTNTVSCTRPIGFKVASELTAKSGDCDDSDQNRYPGAPEACNGKDDDCDGETDEGCVFNNPPEADAGPDQTVVEGKTVKLDGSKSSDSDPGDNIKSYQWTQLGGIPVTLSDPTAVKPKFVTPIVSPAGMILTFSLMVQDKGDLQDNDQVTITVNDNGISGFPDDVLTMTCSTGKEIGIKVESDLVSITAVDPATIPGSSDKPENLPYGLFDLLIKTDAVGGTAKVTFYLESKAGDDDKWFKYKNSTGTWEDCSAYAVFNAARDQVTVTFVDGGDGDDGPADGWIVDPSGLNASSATSTSSGGGGGGGGGCFIATATDG